MESGCNFYRLEYNQLTEQDLRMGTNDQWIAVLRFGRRLLLPAAPKTVVAEPRGSVQYSLSGCDGWPGHAPASEEDRYDQGKEAVLAAVF